MNWIIENYELILAVIGILTAGGFFAAIKNAVKENKEAYKQATLTLDKIKMFKAGGYDSKEIRIIISHIEKFAKEGKEAIEANLKVWNMIKNAFSKKRK